MAVLKPLSVLSITLLVLMSCLTSVVAYAGTSTHYWDCCMVSLTVKFRFVL